MSAPRKLTYQQEIAFAHDRAKRIPIETLSAKYGVSEETLYRTLKKPEIVEIVEHLTLEMIGNVLTDKFIGGSTADRELFLKYLRKWNPKQEVSVTGDITINADAVAKIVQDKLNGIKE